MPQTVMADVAGRNPLEGAGALHRGGLLCVANFPSNTGYAWDFIETLYARLADRLAPTGVKTWVAYPEIDAPPRPLQASMARPVRLDVKLGRLDALQTTLRFVRQHEVRVLYMAGRPGWHPAYRLLRNAGVRRIIVHDHSSGARTLPTGVKRWAKRAAYRAMPSMLADDVIGVSDYVARRKVEVELLPAERVRRIWNSLDMPAANPDAARQLRSELGLPADTLVVITACRAARDKGIDHLMNAFERLDPAVRARSTLVYLGEGPDLARLSALREGLASRDRICFGGYRSNAAALIEGADVCVVPSVWQEAFGLSALEPMTRGVPVIASRVGGIPEIVVDGETGLLVGPGDEGALCAAMRRLLGDADERRRMGENGRRRAQEHFTMDGEIEQLSALIEPGFASSR